MYAFSDIHGNYNLWKQIEAFLKQNNEKAIFLGDAIDRGERGWDILKEMLASDVIVNYCWGNHEQMMIKALEGDFIDKGIWKANGGDPTKCSIEMEVPADVRDVIGTLKNKCEYYVYYVSPVSEKKYFLCHSGFTIPAEGLLEVDQSDLDIVFTWNRDHFNDTEMIDDVVMVHGHTPVKHLTTLVRDYETIGPVMKYADGRKFCIDCYTSGTNTIALFNLDTEEVEVFKDEAKALAE